MTIAIYDVNTFLKNDTTLQTIAGKTMSFSPVFGYSSETVPFVVYFFNPEISSVESFWNRFDNVRYSIFDSDVDRLFKISERIIYLLGRGDTIGETNGIISQYYWFKSAVFVGSNILEPIEKEGWYQMDLDFRIFSTKK